MFRNRVRPPSMPPLDDLTAERLLRGAPVEDLPDAYRPLGRLLADATGPANPDELAGSTAAAAAFVTAHHRANAPRRRRRSLAASCVSVVILAASTGTAFAATQGALPQPMQQVAHDTLGAVGISVPGIATGDDGGTRDPGNSVSTSGTSNDPAVVPSTTPAHPDASTTTTPTARLGGSSPVTGTDPSGGDSGNEGNGGVGPTNPNAGPGNNSGGGNGVDDGGTPPSDGGTTDPGSNLPPQSNGKGNGPQEVPPGQAKKDG